MNHKVCSVAMRLRNTEKLLNNKNIIDPYYSNWPTFGSLQQYRHRSTLLLTRVDRYSCQRFFLAERGNCCCCCSFWEFLRCCCDCCCCCDLLLPPLLLPPDSAASALHGSLALTLLSFAKSLSTSATTSGVTVRPLVVCTYFGQVTEAASICIQGSYEYAVVTQTTTTWVAACMPHIRPYRRPDVTRGTLRSNFQAGATM